MMRPPFARLGRRLRNLRRPGAAELAFAGVALACILLPQWWAITRNREQRRDELRAAMLTTLETTRHAVATWAADKGASARRIASGDALRGAALALVRGREDDPATLLAALRAAERRVEDGAPFDGFALVDAGGETIAASSAEDAGRKWNADLYLPDRGSPGVFRWFDSPDASSDADRLEVGVATPLAAGPSSAYLLLRFDALPDLRNVMASRSLGKTGRTTLFGVGRVWVRQTSSSQAADCDSDPLDTIHAASSDVSREGVDPARTSYNLEGFEGCRGEQTLAAWDSLGLLDLGVITELSAAEAYQSHSATQVTFVLLGLALGACLLLFVLFQTSNDETGERRPENPRRNMAAWGILAVALMATGVGWLSARSRLQQNDRIQFEEVAENIRSQVIQKLLYYEGVLRVAAASYNELGESQSGDWLSMVRKLYPLHDYPAFRCVGLFVGAPREAGQGAGLSCRQRLLGDATASLCHPDKVLDASLAAALSPGSATMGLVSRAGTNEQIEELALLYPVAGPAGPVIGASLDFAVLVRGLPLTKSGVELDVLLAEPGSPQVSLYDSDGLGAKVSDTSRAELSKTFEVAFGGRTLSLILTPAPQLAPPISQNYPAQVLLAGLAISVLLFDIALVLSSTRARALSIAELMTRRYRESEIRMRAVIDNAPDGIVTFDGVGIVHTFNPGAEKLFGYTQEEVPEIRIQDILPVCIPGVVSQLASNTPDGGAGCEGRRKNGEMFPAELTISRMQLADRLLYTAIIRDVSGRHEAEERLRESEERYALAARGANDGLWDWDLKNNEVHYSQRWKSMVGAVESEVGTSPEEWLGRVHSEDVVNLRAQLADHLEGRVPHFECEYRIRHSSGGYRWVLTRGIAVRDSDGRATRIAGSQSDITERKRAERQLLYDALHDPLTGLPNRTYFISRVDQARAEAARSSRRLFGIMFLDIDRFKVINDSLGHYIGDQLLVAVAERLKSCLRPGDTICRLGGDEFAILVENLTSVGDATQIAERIQQELETPVRVGEREMYAAVSIGIALSSTGRQPAEELVRDADIAMYRAKSRGKARYEVFTQRMHTRAVERLQLETDLRQAVEQEQIVLHYQPIVDLSAERVAGCEALMRWNHPVRGLVPPTEFIRVAEETGAILRLTRWSLDQACLSAKAWRSLGVESAYVSLNVSPRQLQQGGLYETVMQALAEHELDTSVLQLELTESALLESSAPNVDTLRKLFHDGVRLALDDFGTGYSSLIYLKRFPLHAIKIDRSFVQRLPQDSGNAAIASGLITMAHSLNLRVTAEGVETVQQLQFLRDQGCDEIQGYLISPAIDDAGVEAFLQETDQVRHALHPEAPLRTSNAPA
jgi:diguanylate cyclase (GGDEF)-like protein/PAS domain S-box-containing protein